MNNSTSSSSIPVSLQTRFGNFPSVAYLSNTVLPGAGVHGSLKRIAKDYEVSRDLAAEVLIVHAHSKLSGSLHSHAMLHRNVIVDIISILQGFSKPHSGLIIPTKADILRLKKATADKQQKASKPLKGKGVESNPQQGVTRLSIRQQYEANEKSISTHLTTIQELRSKQDKLKGGLQIESQYEQFLAKHM